MFQGNCLCTCLLRAFEILFTSIKMRNKLYQLYFINISILLWLYLEVLFQEQAYIKTTFYGKRYESIFCSMYVVVFSVTRTSVTEFS